jgi:hypothetical protein
MIPQRPLGTREVVVIHHTDCGMLTFRNDQLRARIRQELGADAGAIDFLPFGDLEGSVRQDAATLRASPLIPGDIPVSGFVYDVRTGRCARSAEPGRSDPLRAGGPPASQAGVAQALPQSTRVSIFRVSRSRFGVPRSRRS